MTKPIKTIQSDGTLLELTIYSIGRGLWGFAITKENGISVTGQYGDPAYSTEREARKAARHFGKNCRKSMQWGWVYSPKSKKECSK